MTRPSKFSSADPASACQNVPEILELHARRRPDATAFVWLEDGERESATLDFRSLDAAAREVATELLDAGLEGERALMLYRSGLDFVIGFLGCLYARVTAVPVSPPIRSDGIARLEAIARDSGCAAMLVTEEMRALVLKLCSPGSPLRQLPLLLTDLMRHTNGERWLGPKNRVTAETLAFLQYTSGSTGDPKGVAVTHGNLLHNERVVRDWLHHDDDTVFVGWLPLYHDMGLIGNVFQPIYLGTPSVLMAPEAFVRRPARWLEAISRYGGTTSGGPNFGYELCLRRIPEEERGEFDLRSWSAAFNGAEPVQAGTLERFAAGFASSGFRHEAFQPCYGMAEATLFISGTPLGERPKVLEVDEAALGENRVVEKQGGRALVSCGTPDRRQSILIVDPESCQLLRDNEVGEIWLSSSSVASGYHADPLRTKETFGARPAGSEEGSFLRTRDLGFLRGGELFVTGRIDDVMIIRGRNYYPHDIETTAAGSHAYFRAGCVAAFSLPRDGLERVVVVQEVSGRHYEALGPKGDLSLAELALTLRAAVASRHDVEVYEVVLIEQSTIPKTSSGKVRRFACRQGFLDGSLARLGEGTSGLSQGS